MCVTFLKYHGLGNDYLVYDCTQNNMKLSPENIQMICSTNFGLAADGILIGPIMKEDKMHVQVLNPDGSEAKNSGDGVCIFAKYLQSTGLIKEDKFCLYTPGEAAFLCYNSDTASAEENCGKAPTAEVRSVGKLILTDEFIRDNRIGA
ncbi:MAG: hypothetical protein Q4F21_06170 [Lachnospiraceae bacterium]|nr:hypothetical protein [Lachnospiraceae bacterium]